MLHARKNIQNLYKALKRLEWSNFDPDRKDMYCPACGNSHDKGHKSNCIVSVALTENITIGESQ